MSQMEAINRAVAYVQQRYARPLDVAAILGSGLGDYADRFPEAVKIPFSEIPGFPKSTVEGHQGALCLAEVRPGLHVGFLQGRVHFYEGHSMADVVFPLRVLQGLGAKTLIVTNSAGGVNVDFPPGTLMMITDHLNLMGAHPLIGENLPELGPRFPDMSAAYTPELQVLARRIAEQNGINLAEGVYCGLTGPSYETPAEIRMIRTLGGDAVGMSTVPEVIAASHMGMQVLGISCVTNPAAGVMPGHRLNHEEVLETANRVKDQFAKLIQGVLEALPVSVAS